MKKKHLIFHFLYYVLSIVIYMAFFYAASLMLDLTGKTDNLGSVIAVTYGVLFVMTPVLVAVLMRFSLFKWYVDPIAAAEIPLFLYTGMIFNQMKRSGDIRTAFLVVNNKLSDDGGEGWFFLIGLFVFGLVMSLSFARKKGQSISYKLLAKISHKSTIHSANNKPEQYGNDDDHRTTDWKFDFSSLPHWDRRNTIPFVYDKFYAVPQNDILCCIYSIAEVRMCWYTGLLAILKNKECPELILNIAESITFCDNFSVNKNGDILFLQPSIYDKVNNTVSCPILIMDLTHKKFACYGTDNYNPCYKVIEISDTVFSFEADETQIKTDERLNALAKQKIDLNSLKWFDFSELNNLTDTSKNIFSS